MPCFKNLVKYLDNRRIRHPIGKIVISHDIGIILSLAVQSYHSSDAGFFEPVNIVDFQLLDPCHSSTRSITCVVERVLEVSIPQLSA